MTAPVYTKRFFAAHPTAGGSTSVWFVPQTSVYIARSVTLASFHSAAQLVMLFLYTGSPALQIILVGATLSQYQSATIDLRQELKPGDEIRVYGQLGETSAIMSGFVFTP